MWYVLTLLVYSCSDVLPLTKMIRYLGVYNISICIIYGWSLTMIADAQFSFKGWSESGYGSVIFLNAAGTLQSDACTYNSVTFAARWVDVCPTEVVRWHDANHRDRLMRFAARRAYIYLFHVDDAHCTPPILYSVCHTNGTICTASCTLRPCMAVLLMLRDLYPYPYGTCFKRSSDAAQR